MLIFFRAFKEGFSFTYPAARLICRRDMVKWAIVPICVSTIILVGGLLMVGFFLYAQLEQYLSIWPSYLRNIIWWFLICTLSSTLSFLLFSVSNLLAAPFNSQLSAAIECKLGNQNRNSNSDAGAFKNITDSIISIGSEIKKLGCFLKLGLPLLICSLIPGLNLFAPIAWLLFGSWMLSLEYIDYPLSNNGRGFPAAKNYAAQERGLTLGLGFSLTILTLLPIANILAMPIGVAAGTLFYDQKIRKELITPHATNDR